MPYLPPPRFVWAAQVLEATIAGNDVVKLEGGARGGNGERERGVEVGERAIDKANRAKGVGCCKCGS